MCIGPKFLEVGRKGKRGIETAISAVIDSAPQGWATRIAVYGRWGDGKTTILNFVASQQHARSNVVVRFASWLAGSELNFGLASPKRSEHSSKSPACTLAGCLRYGFGCGVVRFFSPVFSKAPMLLLSRHIKWGFLLL